MIEQGDVAAQDMVGCSECHWGHGDRLQRHVVHCSVLEPNVFDPTLCSMIPVENPCVRFVSHENFENGA